MKNGLTTSLQCTFFFENAKNLGRSDDAKRRKKEDGLTNKEISQIIKQAVPEIREKGDEIRFGSFNR